MAKRNSNKFVNHSTLAIASTKPKQTRKGRPFDTKAVMLDMMELQVDADRIRERERKLCEKLVKIYSEDAEWVKTYVVPHMTTQLTAMLEQMKAAKK